MRTASSASRAWGADASASLNTATEPTPSSLHARTMRSAISPRFAIRILSNTQLALGRSQDLAHRCALKLRTAHEAVAEHAVGIDEKGGGMRAVERIDAERVPDAVRLDHLAIAVAEDGKAIRLGD